MTTSSSGAADRAREQVMNDYAGKAQSAGVGRRIAQVGAASYAAETVEGLPSEAVGASFGCGNPLAFAGVREGDTVVDLGSGAGMDLLLAVQRTGAAGKVIGVDMTDAMIARARAAIASAGATNVEVRKGLIESLPVETASTDWVISNCVVNLSPEKHRVFAEIARILRPGGQMLISDIVVGDVPSWVRTIVRVFNASVAAALSEGGYVDGLRRSGLTGVEVRGRHVYEQASIEGMLVAELDGLVESRLAGATARRVARSLLAPLATQVARVAAGKVTSVQMYARRAQDDA
jgi:SAM-dependent methyltransferase